MTIGLKDLPIDSIEDEALGFADYADSLSKFIIKCDTPLTIAIQGDWGSGKTSLMNLMKNTIENEINDIKTIWFNSWQYSQFDMEEDLPRLLLSHFIHEIGGDKKAPLLRLIWRFANRPLKIAAMVLGGKKAGEAYDELIKTSGMQIKELKQELQQQVKKMLEGSYKDRVVVFIDDLDRLIPIKAVELLQVLKLFLDIPGCVFVLAVDIDVIIKGLKDKFGIESNEKRDFFDKIVQLPFYMPSGLDSIGIYVEKLLKEIGVHYNQEDINSYAEMVKHSIGPNPRSVRRLFNSFLLLDIIAEKKNLLGSDKATEEEKLKTLFGVLCLQSCFEPIHKHMQDNPDEIGRSILKTLQNEEELKKAKWYQEIIANNEVDTKKLINFIKFFYKNIQLTCDQKRDPKSDTLCEDEIRNLISMLKLSKITSATIPSESGYINKIMKYPKELLYDLAKYASIKKSNNKDNL